MRWSDERYVRFYTRDTAEWNWLSLEAQGLIGLIMRKADRAGLIPLGRFGKKGVALAIGHPSRWDTISPALEELLEDGCVIIQGENLVIRNFIAAQEAPKSDAARKREQRDRDAAKALESDDTVSRDVTSGHAESRASQNVTPNCAVPCLAVPSVPVKDPAPPSASEPQVGVTEASGDPPPEAATTATGPKARKEPTGPAADCYRHWRDVAWPRVSPVPYPDKKSDHIQLAAKVKQLGAEVVIAAMNRAVEDPYWRDKLDLALFCSKLPQFLPKTGPPSGAGGPRSSVAAPSKPHEFLEKPPF